MNRLMISGHRKPAQCVGFLLFPHALTWRECIRLDPSPIDWLFHLNCGILGSCGFDEPVFNKIGCSRPPLGQCGCSTHLSLTSSRRQVLRREAAALTVATDQRGTSLRRPGIPLEWRWELPRLSR